VKEVDLLVFGSGSLTHALVLALATRPRERLSLTLAARNEAALTELALLAGARAAALDGSLPVGILPCDYSDEALTRVFDSVKPRVVLVLASRQSPWSMSPRWRALVSAAGYGLTLPFQAVLAEAVIRAANERHSGAICLNGCYPDLTNSVLKDRGLRVEGGIGNIAIVAAVLKSLYPGNRVQLVAHHAHVSALIRGSWGGTPPPMVWLDGRAQDPSESAALATRVRLPADDALNQVTGAAAVPMLQALAGRGAPWRGHAPGVHGQIGGCPVRASPQGLHVELPTGLSLEEMHSANLECCRSDGLTVRDGLYSLTRDPDDVEREVGVCLPDALLRWRAASLNEQVDRLEAFRETLGPLQ